MRGTKKERTPHSPATDLGEKKRGDNYNCNPVSVLSDI
jgi:hypothetical protein